jgi:alpha-methylacyl-CoA racemase
VVELAGVGPAPFASMLLADLGADVVRVERPGGGLLAGPPAYELLTRGRPSVALDLKHPEATAAVLDLADRADALVEGFRPGVAERLGLGPDACLQRNPRLVYARMTGWGQHGPLARSAGHDIDYLAVAGALHGIGRADGPPQVPANLLGDFGGGALYLVVGVLAALLHANATGKGQVVDAAIVDGTAHLSTMLVGMLGGGTWRPDRGTNLLDTGAPFYDVYACADGEHVAVGALEPQFWAALCERLHPYVGDEPLPDRDDPRQWPALRARLADVFATRTRAEWTEVFDGSDACVAPVLTYSEAAEHPHLRARATYVERGGIVQPAPAPRFSATPAGLSTPPSRPGQHTAETLRRWGVDPEPLLASGAATQEETP